MTSSNPTGFIDVELPAGLDTLTSLGAWLQSRAEAAAAQQRSDASAWSGSAHDSPAPFVIGITGSVAVGKSTVAAQVADQVRQWATRPTVQVVSTDAFLFANSVLDARGLSLRKGFPESYDQDALVSFLVQVRQRVPDLQIPVYSHVRYDVLTDQHERVDRPDVLIIEGLALLGNIPGRGSLVSDHLDVVIDVDADEADIERWFVDRFAQLRVQDFGDELSFYAPFAALSDEESEGIARWTWNEINAVNLREHVLPVRCRADLLLRKGPDHQIIGVSLRTA